jgi:hypothetical protein
VLVTRWVEHYNTVRLHSAIGYITPAGHLAGRGPAIWAQRDARLEAAREPRSGGQQPGSSFHNSYQVLEI